MYIESVVDDALKEANLSVDNLDAIAVTNRPGNRTRAMQCLFNSE